MLKCKDGTKIGCYFWQNQLNFATWCATTGCGVDYENHINGKGMLGSVFKLHVYYQIRRILFEIRASIPGETNFLETNNTFDRNAYSKICQEFNVDSDTDWRLNINDNNGLGRIYDRWSYHEKKVTIVDPGTAYPTTGDWVLSFTKKSVNNIINIEYIQQQKTEDGWTRFILDSSEGFTHAGVERINDSIRTYCWAILGSQAQKKSNILGLGTAFDAQKQCLSNIEDTINSPIDLPSQIERYQNTLKYARSKVDFVYGIGLYMQHGVTNWYHTKL